MDPTPQELLLELAEALNAMRDRLTEVAPYPEDLAKLIPELQKMAGDGSESQEDLSAQMDLSAMVSDIDRVIADLQNKVAASGDVLADIDAHVANLRSVQSEIQSLMMQLQNGMATAAMVKGAVAALGNAAESAAGAAHSSATSTVSEQKMESYDAVYAKAQEARLEYARELMAQTEYFQEMDEALTQMSTGYANLSESDRLDVNVMLRAQETTDPDGFGRAARDVRLATEQGKLDEVLDIKAQDKTSIDAARESLSGERKEWIDRLTGASRIGHQEYSVTVDLKDLVERIKSGDPEVTSEFIDAEEKRITAARDQLINQAVSIMHAQDPATYAALDSERKEKGFDSVAAYIAAEAIDPANADPEVNSPAMIKASVLTEATQNINEMSGYIRAYAQDLGIDLSKDKLTDKDLAKFDGFIGLPPKDAVQAMIEAGVMPKEDRAMMVSSLTQMEVMSRNVQSGKDPEQAQKVLLSYAGQMQKREGESDKDYQNRLRGLEAKIEREAGLKEGTLYAVRSPEFQQSAMNIDLANRDPEAYDAGVKAAFENSQDNYSYEVRAERIAASYVLAASEAAKDFVGGNVKKRDDFWSERGDEIFKTMIDNGLNAEDAHRIVKESISAIDYQLSDDAELYSDYVALKQQASSEAQNALGGFDDGTGAMGHMQSGGELMHLQRLAYEEFQKDPTRFSNAPKGSTAKQIVDLARDHMAAEARFKDTHTSFEERREAALVTLAEQAGLAPDAYLSPEAAQRRKEAEEQQLALVKAEQEAADIKRQHSKELMKQGVDPALAAAAAQAKAAGVTAAGVTGPAVTVTSDVVATSPALVDKTPARDQDNIPAPTKVSGGTDVAEAPAAPAPTPDKTPPPAIGAGGPM
jgi:hypothetical protein